MMLPKCYISVFTFFLIYKVVLVLGLSLAELSIKVKKNIFNSIVTSAKASKAKIRIKIMFYF